MSSSSFLPINNIQALIASAKAVAGNIAAQGGGEVNKREAQFLANEASQVQHLVDQSMADGFVDDKEMKAINQAVKQLGNDVNRLTHNFAGGSVDGRQDNTARRTDAGAKDGSLTQGETSAIQKKQAEVDALIGNARADNKVTAQEQKEINQAQRGLSKEIYQSRHNDQGVDLSSRNNGSRVSELRSQVDQAVQSGQLDGAQAMRLTYKLNLADQLIAGAKADGWIDPAEQRAINQALASVEKALPGQTEPGSPGGGARAPRDQANL
jgi:uncharacterized membrane protein YebE (DUF533 family)